RAARGAKNRKAAHRKPKNGFHAPLSFFACFASAHILPWCDKKVKSQRFLLDFFRKSCIFYRKVPPLEKIRAVKDALSI
ncbi:MAG: hypothetical protein Q4C48_06325, partial [Lachnospiraceae bacterium]|nr:hypothetical protein [Lachnospiraceae bacterium]